MYNFLKTGRFFAPPVHFLATTILSTGQLRGRFFSETTRLFSFEDRGFLDARCACRINALLLTHDVYLFIVISPNGVGGSFFFALISTKKKGFKKCGVTIKLMTDAYYTRTSFLARKKKPPTPRSLSTSSTSLTCGRVGVFITRFCCRGVAKSL